MGFEAFAINRQANAVRHQDEKIAPELQEGDFCNRAGKAPAPPDINLSRNISRNKGS